MKVGSVVNRVRLETCEKYEGTFVAEESRDRGGGGGALAVGGRGASARGVAPHLF